MIMNVSIPCVTELVIQGIIMKQLLRDVIESDIRKDIIFVLNTTKTRAII